MKNTDILNANGKLTAYGFACGYVQSVRTESLNKEIFMEHAHYQVRSIKHNTPKLNSDFCGPTSHLFTIWETFDRLGPAKKLYNAIK